MYNLDSYNYLHAESVLLAVCWAQTTAGVLPTACRDCLCQDPINGNLVFILYIFRIFSLCVESAESSLYS